MNEIKEKLKELLLELSNWPADELIMFQSEWISELKRKNSPQWLIQWCSALMQVLIDDSKLVEE